MHAYYKISSHMYRKYCRMVANIYIYDLTWNWKYMYIAKYIATKIVILYCDIINVGYLDRVFPTICFLFFRNRKLIFMEQNILKLISEIISPRYWRLDISSAFIPILFLLNIKQSTTCVFLTFAVLDSHLSPKSIF